MFNFNISTAAIDDVISVEQTITTLANGTVLDGLLVDAVARDYFLGRLDAGDSRRFEKKIVAMIGKPENEIYDALDRITEVTRKMNKW